MLVTDTIQLRDTATHAATEIEAIISRCPEDVRERLSSLALALRLAVEPLLTPSASYQAVLVSTTTLPLPAKRLSALTFEEACSRLDNAHPLISTLLEAFREKLAKAEEVIKAAKDVVATTRAAYDAKHATLTDLRAADAKVVAAEAAAQPARRLHRMIVKVDDAVGEAISVGSAAHSAGKSDPLVVGTLRGHINYCAVNELSVALSFPEAKPYRAQIEKLITALTL